GGGGADQLVLGVADEVDDATVLEQQLLHARLLLVGELAEQIGVDPRPEVLPRRRHRRIPLAASAARQSRAQHSSTRRIRNARSRRATGASPRRAASSLPASWRSRPPLA